MIGNYFEASEKERIQKQKDRQNWISWLRARDALFGWNYAKRDIEKALELAGLSEHEEAVWIRSILSPERVWDVQLARNRMLEISEQPGPKKDRAFVYAYLFGNQQFMSFQENARLMAIAAEGDTLAMTLVR